MVWRLIYRFLLFLAKLENVKLPSFVIAHFSQICATIPQTRQTSPKLAVSIRRRNGDTAFRFQLTRPEFSYRAPIKRHNGPIPKNRAGGPALRPAERPVRALHYCFIIRSGMCADRAWNGPCPALLRSAFHSGVLKKYTQGELLGYLWW